LDPSLIARQEVTAAAVGHSIYVVGGFATGATLTTQVERYDADHGRWSLVSPMPMPINHGVAFSRGGQLYVLGGYTGFPGTFGLPTGGIADATAAFFRYAPAADRWFSMPSAPRPRAAFAAALIGDSLYAAGGVTAGPATDSMDVFDFQHGTWRDGPPMPIPAEHVAGAALNDAFYVLGGRSIYGAANDTVARRYDPRTGRWRLVADMTHGHAGFAAATVCGTIVAFGGEQPGEGLRGTIGRSERYDPTVDAWRLLPDLGVARHGLGGVAIGQRVYAIEGGDITSASATDVVEALDLPCPASFTGPTPAHRARLAVSVRPARVRTGRPVRFSVVVHAGRATVRGALVGLHGARARTDGNGTATLVVRFRHRGRYVVRATLVGLLPGRAAVRVLH
jgi:hypothetical protein